MENWFDHQVCPLKAKVDPSTAKSFLDPQFDSFTSKPPLKSTIPSVQVPD